MTTTKTITFAIHCDDRRWCANGVTTINTHYKAIAHRIARERGWRVNGHTDAAKCPACQQQQHPRREP